LRKTRTEALKPWRVKHAPLLAKCLVLGSEAQKLVVTVRTNITSYAEFVIEQN
jgi:hypothetical protein